MSSPDKARPDRDPGQQDGRRSVGWASPSLRGRARRPAAGAARAGRGRGRGPAAAPAAARRGGRPSRPTCRWTACSPGSWRWPASWSTPGTPRSACSAPGRSNPCGPSSTTGSATTQRAPDRRAAAGPRPARPDHRPAPSRCGSTTSPPTPRRTASPRTTRRCRRSSASRSASATGCSATSTSPRRPGAATSPSRTRRSSSRSRPPRASSSRTPGSTRRRRGARSGWTATAEITAPARPAGRTGRRPAGGRRPGPRGRRGRPRHRCCCAADGRRPRRSRSSPVSPSAPRATERHARRRGPRRGCGHRAPAQTVVVDDARARRPGRPTTPSPAGLAGASGRWSWSRCAPSDGVEGVLTLAWTPDRVTAFHDVDVRLAERFAAQAALALQVARAREDREKLAVFEDRDRIARDLHDLVIQRLFAIGLALENTARRVRAGRRAGDGSRRRSTTSTRRSRTSGGRSSRSACRRASTDLRATVPSSSSARPSSWASGPALRFEGPVDSYGHPGAARRTCSPCSARR